MSIQSNDEPVPVQYRDLDPLGYPGYRIGDDGSFWSAWRQTRGKGNGNGGAWVIGTVWRRRGAGTNGGYPQAYLPLRRGVFRLVYVHALVLAAFVGPCPEGMEACHWDGDPGNNRLDNLRWDVPKANAADTVRHGRVPRGERHCFAKLTAERVVAIRRRLAAGESQTAIARSEGVGRNTVWKIAAGKTWRHVPEQEG
jgi:hypothetical protein